MRFFIAAITATIIATTIIVLITVDVEKRASTFLRIYKI